MTTDIFFALNSIKWILILGTHLAILYPLKRIVVHFDIFENYLTLHFFGIALSIKRFDLFWDNSSAA